MDAHPVAPLRPVDAAPSEPGTSELTRRRWDGLLLGVGIGGGTGWAIASKERDTPRKPDTKVSSSRRVNVTVTAWRRSARARSVACPPPHGWLRHLLSGNSPPGGCHGRRTGA